VRSKNSFLTFLRMFYIKKDKKNTGKVTQSIVIPLSVSINLKSIHTEFVHKVRCAFELIMIRENILSIPGMQLTTEDCIWCISQLLT